MRRLTGWIAALMCSAGQACGPAGGGDGDALVSRGRAVYAANCIACHASDPTREGGLGPAVAGASRALLDARILEGGYPEGYRPKRDTRVMPPQPHLEADLPALHAFLNAASAEGS